MEVHELDFLSNFVVFRANCRVLFSLGCLLVETVGIQLPGRPRDVLSVSSAGRITRRRFSDGGNERM